VTARLPQLLASSVVRGTQLGESHGGLYLIDLEARAAELKLDWNRSDVDFSGRGGDRGLRGIAFHGPHILVAANAQLLVLDRSFQVLETFTNPYLQHCHEIHVADDHVYLTSTGFDSLLAFDLKSQRFEHGFYLGVEREALRLRHFDPMSVAGPPPGRRFHLNSVYASATGLWFSGLHTPGLLHFDGRDLKLALPLPAGSHNAQPYANGVLYNDTASERICFQTPERSIQLPVPRFPREQIMNIDRFGSTVARAGFARGLCVMPNGWIAGGCSPSTVAVYDLQAGKRITQVNLSMDVRNAIHGLAVWPH
jgi:hypothetical protein